MFAVYGVEKFIGKNFVPSIVALQKYNQNTFTERYLHLFAENSNACQQKSC